MDTLAGARLGVLCCALSCIALAYVAVCVPLPDADSSILKCLSSGTTTPASRCDPIVELIPAQLDRYRASGVNIVSLNICWDGVSPDLALPMAEAFRACVAQAPRSLPARRNGR